MVYPKSCTSCTCVLCETLAWPEPLPPGGNAYRIERRDEPVGEAIPTVEAIPAEVGKPEAAALDNGYRSPTNVEALTVRGIEPYIATGRDSHHQTCRSASLSTTTSLAGTSF